MVTVIPGSMETGRLGSNYGRIAIGSPGKESGGWLGPAPWRENMAKLTTVFLG